MNEPSNFNPVNCPQNKYEFPDVRISNSNQLLINLIVLSFFLSYN